jgi:hypothetical protein
MRNLFNPTITEIGTLTLRGRDYHVQRISYGSRYNVHVFRKGALHLHGLVFETQAAYDAWKQGLKTGQTRPVS